MTQGISSPDPQPHLMIGAGIGLVLLALGLIVGSLQGGWDERGWRGLLLVESALAATLLAGVAVTTVLTHWAIVRRRLPRSSLGRVGQYWQPESRIRLRRVDGSGEYEVRLVGVPSTPVVPGLTLRPRPARWRREPRATSRLELLAGPDGPVVGLITGSLPWPAYLARATDRLGYLVAALVALVPFLT